MIKTIFSILLVGCNLGPRVPDAPDQEVPKLGLARGRLVGTPLDAPPGSGEPLLTGVGHLVHALRCERPGVHVDQRAERLHELVAALGHRPGQGGNVHGTPG